MKLRTNLADIRGKRSVKQIAQASGVNEATIRQIERGTLLPREAHVESLERAYGVPIEKWYSPRALLALQEDEAA